ncbi:MAG: hypothetical protein KG012_14200 [Deltaproteobacteria bacterium]|nr:hypothetical protein [Deltaproteobacteria bacterium]MBS3920026.1 hypothetical protein [Deltaproteobacteria bacterium]
MSWESIFKNIENLLKLITIIGPIIEFIEMLFGKVFPGQKKGEKKKALAMEWGRLIVSPEVGDEELSAMIEEEVAARNDSGEFTHCPQGF